MKRFLLAACSLIVLFSTGCAAEARDNSSAQGGADSSLCSDLDAMVRTVTTAKTINPFSTPGDVKKTRAELEKTVAAVQDSAEGEGLDASALSDEVVKFGVFATRVPPGVTIGSSGRILSAQVIVIGRELDILDESAGCDAR
jgi:hypothetical protein